MELFAKLPYDIQQIIYNMKRLDEIEREQRIHHDQLVSLFDRVESCHEHPEDFPDDDELCVMWDELHEWESVEPDWMDGPPTEDSDEESDSDEEEYWPTRDEYLAELREMYEAMTDPRSDDEL